ncbi:hypothetical protein C0995_002143 [Termitomyces sp. Mi166|nr:hypothetical protein C0995_002143 [Termitomyces sp. Mi166\
MSSTRAADPLHSKFLLQSRSLRDFRTPPPRPPPRPDKNRRRVIQANDLHTVREAHPSVPRIGEPSHAEMYQTPQNPRSHLRHNSVQVSPFIAAPRTSFDGASPVSSYRSSPNLSARRPPISSSTGIHELRNPPVNPRRHRRLCSDFGLNRKDARASPIVDVSSLASTPLTTHTETDSDSDVSVNQSLDYSFPEPPPISETLHLRRMHSSPVFDLGETDQVRDVLRKRWGVPVQVLPARFDHWDGTSSTSIDSHYDLEDLDATRSTIHRINDNNAPRIRLKEQHPSLISQRLGLASPPPLPLPGAGKDISWKRATTATIPHNRKSEATSLSLIRSASSVGLSEASPTKAYVGPAAQRRFGSLPPELSESTDRLNLSIEKLKTHNPHQLPSLDGTTVLGENRRKPEFRMSLSPPSLASAGRKRPASRPYVPFPTFVPEHPSNSKTSQEESDHRPTRDRPIALLPTRQSDQPIPRSFIDITPERETERGPRSRVRKLLARASVSMFGWGKNVSRTKKILKRTEMD